MLLLLMRIIGRDVLFKFSEKYPDSSGSLKSWFQMMEESEFKHFPNLKQAFRSADYVKPNTVFDISGNKYRMITVIDYSIGLVKIRQIIKHSEYDKGKWKK